VALGHEVKCSGALPVLDLPHGLGEPAEGRDAALVPAERFPTPIKGLDVAEADMPVGSWSDGTIGDC
jgi:hypothetical protein